MILHGPRALLARHHDRGDFPLRIYPRLLAHAERVRARPRFQRALSREKLPTDPAML